MKGQAKACPPCEGWVFPSGIAQAIRAKLHLKMYFFAQARPRSLC